MEYKFTDIEPKWQQKWKEDEAYKVCNDSLKPKCYVLDMFPYPSGAGLHVGHPLGYIASDIYARYKRSKGFNVLHPMGFDSFGLPAEQYALETGQHPAETTKKNIATFKAQLDKIGFCYDWTREVQTSDPNYYKWTQWIFLRLFNSYFCHTEKKALPISQLVKKYETKGALPKSGDPVPGKNFAAEQWNAYSKKEQEDILMKRRLAFSAYGEVNWCEALGTVLANDEVVNGVSERGGHPVEKKKMRQWYLRITEYADRLLEGLETVDFSDSMKEMQRNWIGKSEGAEILFPIPYLIPFTSPQVEKGEVTSSPSLLHEVEKGDAEIDAKKGGGEDSLESHTNIENTGGSELSHPSPRSGEGMGVRVYTTRPDTIFGADFMVIAPEHELVEKITTAAQEEAIEKYFSYVKSRSDRERLSEVKQITGCFTGAYAINPFDGREIPVWISEYVLAGYGTGAIMAVPCGDQRDFAFAKHFNIPITNIIGEHYTGEEANPTKDAILQNSGFLNGLLMKDAIDVAINKIEEQGIGKRKVNYRMRDAGFSRQRYWGEPFPIIWRDGIAIPLDAEELPLELPHVDKYGPGPAGEGPLANLKEWTSSSSPSLLHEVEKGDAEIEAKKGAGDGSLESHANKENIEGSELSHPSPRSGEGMGVRERAASIPKYSVRSPLQYELAKQMRKEYTEAENHLWQQVRANKLETKFRRQHPIESYIVDFVSLQHALIVEVDGGYHETAEQKIYDEERTRVLNEIGFTIIRFSNDAVLNDSENVISKIKEALTSSPSLLHPVEKGDAEIEAKKGAGDGSLESHANKENIGGSELNHPSPRSGEGMGVRETSTMPGYAGSSWYFLRYMDPHNNQTFCDRKASDYWNQVDLYIGGTEHAVGHLLYSRMWTKVLFDLNLIGFDEPFKKLLNQGMITGKSYFFKLKIDAAKDSIPSKTYIVSNKNPDEVHRINDTTTFNVQLHSRFKYGHQYVDSNGKLTKKEFERYLTDHELIDNEVVWDKDGDDEFIYVKEEVEKMSKSKFNVDNPDEIVQKYGADTFRMYEMFLGPVEASKPWDTKGIEGVHRFLRKLWRLFFDEIKGKVWVDEKPTDAELKILHRTIKKIEEDTERFSFNTAVSTFMICVNELADLKCNKKEILEPLLILLAPYAPHISEELYQQLWSSQVSSLGGDLPTEQAGLGEAGGARGSVLDAQYPAFDPALLTESSKEYPVSINGKLRTSIILSLDLEQQQVEEMVLQNEVVQKWLEGRPPKKIIFVRNKMINVVV